MNLILTFLGIIFGLSMLIASNSGGRGVFRFWLVLLGLSVLPFFFFGIYLDFDLAAYLWEMFLMPPLAITVPVGLGYLLILIARKLPHVRMQEERQKQSDNKSL